MARSLSNAKLLAASVSDGLSSLSILRRRGYAAAATQVSAGGYGRGSVVVVRGKVEERSAAVNFKEETSGGGGASTAWGPDPITGYYRPANCAPEIDPVELREMLLNHRVRPN